jgi:hypothetical protein
MPPEPKFLPKSLYNEYMLIKMKKKERQLQRWKCDWHRGKEDSVTGAAGVKSRLKDMG